MWRRSFRRLEASTAGIKLEDIPLKRAWNYEKPTLVLRGRQIERLPHLRTNEDLIAHLYRSYPLLQDLDLTNFAIKGGVFASLMMSQTPSDIDLYVVGLNHEESAKAVDRLLNQIVKVVQEKAMRKAKENSEEELPSWGQHERGRGRGNFGSLRGPMRGGSGGRQGQRDRLRREKMFADAQLSRILGVRHGPVITLSGIEGLASPLQIVADPYKSVESLVESGDVDSGCIAFYNKELTFHKRSAFAIQNWANVIHPQEGMLAVRFESYFQRGFDLILPDLDVSKIRMPDPRLNMNPFFRLIDGQIEIETSRPDVNRPNRLVVESLRRIATPGDGASPDGGASAVPNAMKKGNNMRGNMRDNTKMQVMEALRHNVREIHSADSRFKYNAGGKNITTLAEFRAPPINERHVENTLHHKCVSSLQKSPLNPSEGFRTLFKYFPDISLADTISAMIPSVDEGEAEANIRVEQACARAEKLQCEASLKKLEGVRSRMMEQSIEEILKMEHRVVPMDIFYGQMGTASK